MAENEKTADATDLKTLLATVTELAKNQKIMADTMAADAEARKTAQTAAEAKATADAAAAKEAAGKGEAAKPLTAAEIDALVTQKATSLLDERFKAQQTSSEQTAARDKFVGEKMKDLPALYQSQLKGTDPEAWKTQEQTIRAQAKADAAAMGFVVKDVGGAGGGAGQGAGGGTAANQFNGALTPGQAKFAAELKLPTA